MTTVDLITGFLGAGKTTFLRQYAAYFLKKGERICILENDYGAVNIDLMLVKDLMSESCDMETVAGGCDADCHKRRFKTKLIAMGMQKYDRVIIEPSGIYDMDEFFDTLREEPLDSWYQIGSVISVVDGSILDSMSEKSKYMLASQVACSSMIVLSHLDEVKRPVDELLPDITSHLSQSLLDIGCDRTITSDQIYGADMLNIPDEELLRISRAGYVVADYKKKYLSTEEGYSSVYLMNSGLTPDGIPEFVNKVFSDPACGKIHRIKGFVRDDSSWYKVNATARNASLTPASDGQEVVIVIGEDLNEAAIRSLL